MSLERARHRVVNLAPLLRRGRGQKPFRLYAPFATVRHYAVALDTGIDAAGWDPTRSRGSAFCPEYLLADLLER